MPSEDSAEQCALDVRAAQEALDNSLDKSLDARRKPLIRSKAFGYMYQTLHASELRNLAVRSFHRMSQKFITPLVSDVDWKTKVLDAEPTCLAVVDVHAQWCGPCTGLGKRLINLSGDFMEYAGRALPSICAQRATHGQHGGCRGHGRRRLVAALLFFVSLSHRCRACRPQL